MFSGNLSAQHICLPMARASGCVVAPVLSLLLLSFSFLAWLSISQTFLSLGSETPLESKALAQLFTTTADSV